MKRIILALLAFLLGAVLLTACDTTNNRNDIGSDDKISVVATIFPPYDFTRAIAGNNADITMLLSPGSESHSFEPTPQDIMMIQDCDVFIYVGGDSDAWVDRVLAAMDLSGKKVVTLMDCVETVEEELVEGMEHEHDHDREHGHDEHEHEHEHEHDQEHEHEHDHDQEHGHDEHVWTSPRNAILIVERISDTLREVDPQNAADYKKNTDDYIARLAKLDLEFQEVADSATRKTIVFGDRFPFRYFTDAYGLEYFAAFSGCSTETQASSKTVAFLIDKVKDESIPVVFHIEFSNGKLADTISESTGAKVLLLHSCHNITASDFKSGKTYLDIMAANVEALREALK